MHKIHRQFRKAETQMLSTQKSTLTTHIYVLHKPVLGQWEAAQDSESLGFLRHFKENLSGTNTTPSNSQCAAVVPPGTFIS